jgi:hypothetical protein
MNFNEANVYYDKAEFDERIFLDQLLASLAGDDQSLHTIFSEIMEKQYVPGIVYPNSSLFYSNLREEYLKEIKKGNFNLSKCSTSAACPKEFLEVVQFARDIQIINPVKDYTPNFHSKRVDLYLGQFLRNFPDEANFLKSMVDIIGGFYLLCYAKSIENLDKSLVSGLLSSYFMPEFSYIDPDSINCINASTKLLQQSHETFLDIVKHSVLKNSLSEMQKKMEFQSSYEESLKNAFELDNTESPIYLSEQVEMLHFCSKTVKTKDLLKDEDKDINCDFFKPMLTSKGPCFTYNALSMKQLYKGTKHLNNWNNAFGHETAKILRNDRSDPVIGLHFVVISFDKYLESSKSQNFLLAIANKYEPHIMTKRRYVIEPGFIYKFGVIAKQIVSSEALNQMSPNDRKCLLKNENVNLNFSKFYTKDTCEYECMTYRAVEECGCAPWYTPFFDNKPYCDVQTHCGFYSETVSGTICDLREDCFDNYLNNASTDQCNCPMECEGTDYSIIKSNQPFLLPKNICTDDKLKTQYPFTVYCEMCHKIIQYHKIRLVYDHYRRNKPHPDDINAFCQYFISNYTAVVKIEMVSKSVMRSVRDKRFSLMSQVSQLGKN